MRKILDNTGLCPVTGPQKNAQVIATLGVKFILGGEQDYE